MAFRNKPTTTPATRSSSRNKTPATRLQPSRTTRAATKVKENSLPLDTLELPVPPATPARKPLWNLDNAVDTPATIKRLPAPRAKLESTKVTEVVQDVDQQPIKAFLRIRSRTSKEPPASTPYLTTLSDTAVRMTDPSPTSILQASSSQTIYTFSKVFPPETNQAEFFTSTALPLVRDLLGGQNGLLFTYGVTNSGKTYTIQGGAGKGDAGLLPRTLDVVFNSIEGLQSDAPFRPTRLGGVERDGDDVSSANASLDVFGASQKPIDLSPDIDQSILAAVIAEQIDPSDKDETSLQVDRNYEYSVWVSYAEVYNEKVFDLLGAACSDTDKPAPDFNKPLLVKRKALTLKNDPEGGKYISGLREVRVRNVGEARAVIKMGQINRHVFGTLANHASSRSHGIFTVKLMRVHNGCPNDPDAVQTARLSIVDLAGSERANNTQNTGERLKEAGNINKSLMVLGQCMEALRINQKRLANAPSARPLNVKLTLVPFRHSKLTELFQDFFVGNGKAVMIVNVNPYDTGFDENAHVMKFAALAKDVTTMQKRPPPSGIPRLAANTNHRRVTISIEAKAGARATETHLEVLEEDEEGDEEVQDSEPTNPLIDALFEHVEELRIKLFKAEMRCAIIESEVREEIMKEMEERMTRMDRMYTHRLRNELKENQFKIDRKIDMLQQIGLIGTQARRSSRPVEDLEEEIDVEESLVVETDEEVDEGHSITFSTADHTLNTPTTSDISHMDESPLARKTNLGVVSRTIMKEDDLSGPIGLFSEVSEEEAETSDCSSLKEDTDAHSIEGRTASEGTCEASDSEWVPDSEGENRTGSDKHLGSPEQASFKIATVKYKSGSKYEKPNDPVFDDFLEPEAGGTDSIVIIPSKKARKIAPCHSGRDTRPDEVDDVPKKKKRILRKKAIVTEEEINEVTNKVAKVGLNNGKEGMMVRRLAK